MPIETTIIGNIYIYISQVNILIQAHSYTWTGRVDSEEL
jgi:hypothetical protein